MAGPLTDIEYADDVVVLLDEGGSPIGVHAREEVHTDATPLHLAFSLYLFDDSGRVLLTRRALNKRTWPGVWTNSCCGHPRPGEEMASSIERRLGYELGMELSELECVLPDFAYRATDASGIVENEVCPVYRAYAVHPEVLFAPNSDEVMDWKWVAWDDLSSSIRGTPFLFSPWACAQVALLESGSR